MLCISQVVLAENFSIRSVETVLNDKVYQLNANIQFDFSDEAIKALQNGVPIIILLDMEVYRERSWWWDSRMAKLQQGYLMLYHALTEKYIVTNLNSGAQSDYRSLRSTLAALGRVRNLPLIDAHLLQKNTKYWVKLRVYLDIESLPAPMRPLAYLSSDWQLESDWYQWPIQP